jgi:hypothetical protein
MSCRGGYLKLGNKHGNSLIYIVRSSINANAPHKKRGITAKGNNVSKVCGTTALINNMGLQ